MRLMTVLARLAQVSLVAMVPHSVGIALRVESNAAIWQRRSGWVSDGGLRRVDEGRRSILRSFLQEKAFID